MIRKIALLLLSASLAGAYSCSEDIPECPNKMCIMAGGWKLTEVYIDDARNTEDLSNYSLVLHEPEPDNETTSSFERVHISGNQDAGTWSIENNETILRLIPNNNLLFTEDWMIEIFTPRQLVLVLNRDTGIKQGPSKIRFVLKPF